MSIRETINRHQKITVVCIVLAFASVAVSIVRRSHDAVAQKHIHQLWFTVDDGKSWFADDVSKLPPFDHDGKQAVRCVVFRCGNGPPFAAYLLRYTARGKEQLNQIHVPSLDPWAPKAVQSLVEIKSARDGAQGWLSRSDPRAEDIVNPPCPDGTGPLEEVLP